MSNDADGENLAILAKFGKRATASAVGRRERETRITPYSDRRRMRTTGRTEQLNLRVRPEFRQRLVTISDNTGQLMVEIMERALALYEKHEMS